MAGLGLAASAASAQSIIDEWATVTAPPAPALKPVTLDPKTTALLMLDFVAPNCTQRPRCMASVPAVKKLLTEARAKGMLIVYATGATGKRADTVPDLAPTEGEPVVSTGVDKFVNTDLEKILKAGGTQTVIAMGTAAHGAGLYTRKRRRAAWPESHRSGRWHVGKHPVPRAIHRLASGQRAGRLSQRHADEAGPGQVLIKAEHRG